MFLIIFLWTPPHFWALALFKSADYERVGVPMDAERARSCIDGAPDPRLHAGHRVDGVLPQPWAIPASLWRSRCKAPRHRLHRLDLEGAAHGPTAIP